MPGYKLAAGVARCDDGQEISQFLTCTKGFFHETEGVFKFGAGLIHGLGLFFCFGAEILFDIGEFLGAFTCFLYCSVVLGKKQEELFLYSSLFS